jgi:glycosyltransferase involved in cell wall biosynthesis
VRVAIAVHGRFHAFDAARELAARGVGVWLATTYPAMVARRMLPASIALHTIPHLEVARRVAARMSFLPPIDVWLASRFSSSVARELPASADIFVGWSGASLEAIDVARARGMRVIIERGSSHIAHQAKVLAEYALHGITTKPVDPRMIDREIVEYAAADRIMVPTRYAKQTFVHHGIDPGKLVVNPYGVDLGRYLSMPVQRSSGSVIRVLFVGRVGLRKGISYLLQSFQRLGPEFQLHLVGPVDGEVKSLVRSLPPDRIQIHGPLRGSALLARFRDADLFCLPSLEEGMSLALLQAMASGLPIVATPETGAEDIITSGDEGFLVPARDPSRLVEALMQLRSADPRISMGAAARSRVSTAFSWRAYGERSLAAYRQLLQ